MREFGAGVADRFPVTGDIDLRVDLGPLRLANPVMPASGCFGPELAPLLPLDRLGAVVTKTVFSAVRAGNPAHRLTEVTTGMMNSVGIPSPGSDGFRTGLLPRYQESGAPVVVSIGGLFLDEYFTVAEALVGEDVAAFEINVSCPNLEHGGSAMGTDPAQVARVVEGVRARVPHPLFVKLTPTVSDIAVIAGAAESAGADGLTVCNSFPAMAVDPVTRTTVLGNGGGGLSGPAVKSMALRLVHDTVRAVNIPVIGCGGISTARDAVEFLIAGAHAVQIGTANFTRPYTMAQVIADLETFCRELGVGRVSDLIGTLNSAVRP